MYLPYFAGLIQTYTKFINVVGLTTLPHLVKSWILTQSKELGITFCIISIIFLSLPFLRSLATSAYFFWLKWENLVFQLIRLLQFLLVMIDSSVTTSFGICLILKHSN